MYYTANNLQDCNSHELFWGCVSDDVSPDTVAISVRNVTGSIYSNVTAYNKAVRLSALHSRNRKKIRFCHINVSK